MLTAIEGIIAELRKIGVPVSIAERIDAVQSLPHLPLADRDLVKSALRAVLVKNYDHELAFDTLFELYFAPTPGAPGEADGADGNGSGPSGSGSGRGAGAGSGAGSGSGSLGALDDAGLIDLLVLALGEGNDVLMRAIAGIFVDRHAGF